MYLVTSVINGRKLYHGERLSIVEALELMNEIQELYSGGSTITMLTLEYVIDWSKEI